ncbi:MAG: hypothetical protein RLY93_07640 [Sumerlaeia bacterium]
MLCRYCFLTASLLFAGIAPAGEAEPHGLPLPRQANTGLLIGVLPPDNPDDPTTFPMKLSDLPALLAAGSGQGHTVPGVVPYAPNSPLWSDGAEKERYLALPGLETIEWKLAGSWDFPDGTVLVKNFLLPLDERQPAVTLQRIETRVMLKMASQWHGYSYEWNADETDADLVGVAGKSRSFTLTDSQGQPFDYVWDYPSRGDCFRCHTRVANRVLGLNTPAINGDFHYPASDVTDNQLAAMEYVGLFSDPLPSAPAELPAMPDYRDETHPSLEERAKALLAANCAMCHQPDGPTAALIDLRWETPLDAMDLIGGYPIRGNLGLPNPSIVDPGMPDNSILLLRDESRDPVIMMPPLGTRRADTAGTSLIRDWIVSLGGTGEMLHGWVLYQ